MKKSLAMVLLAAAVIGGCSSEQNAGMPPQGGPVAVGVVTLASQAVPRTIELPGRVVATATAEVRPQVDGIIRKVAFREAHRIAQGDVLYELDDRKFQAAAAAAAAAVRKAEAAAVAAQATFDRSETLAATNAVSAQTLDDARSSLLQAQAEVEAAKAENETARINLDNATILAPIGGVIGLSAVSAGSLVTANQSDSLATIRQIDPIYVTLVDSSANLMRIRDEVEAGRLGREADVAPAVTLTLENGRAYGEKGELTLAEIVVSQTAGTFALRATFPNAEGVLMPGMFVRATVDLGTMPDAFLVPQRAVQRGDDGSATVYLVSEDGKAEVRPITTLGSTGNDWIVGDGVKNGDRLIVDGFQKISAGSAITPVDATIDDDGVVRQTISTGGDAAERQP